MGNAGGVGSTGRAAGWGGPYLLGGALGGGSGGSGGLEGGRREGTREGMRGGPRLAPHLDDEVDQLKRKLAQCSPKRKILR